VERHERALGGIVSGAEHSRDAWQYVHVYSPGPMIVVRMPVRGKPGNRSFAPKMAAVKPALTALMREHGLRGKDMSSWDSLSHPDDWDQDPAATLKRWPFKNAEQIRAEAETLARKLDAAYAQGSSSAFMPAFWFYDWDGSRFALVRAGRE
jgi:hypothetical protein